MCVSCAWAKPAKPHPLEFCENGAKATAWEITSRRADPAFFAAHTARRARGLARPRSRGAGPADAPDALEPGTATATSRSPGRPPSPRSAASSGRSAPEAVGLLHLGPRLARDLATCTSSSRASSAATTCPTRRTCATRARRSRCPRASAPRSAPRSCRTSRTPTASSTSARTSAPRRRGCCTTCRTRSIAASPIVAINPLRERGLERFINPQSPGADAHRARDADRLRLLPDQERRRHRGADGHLQGADRGRRRAKASGARRSPARTTSPKIRRRRRRRLRQVDGRRRQQARARP